MRWALLLRGVNVGGHRKLPMKDLAAFLGELGFSDVRTLLASGNAVFTAPERSAAKLERSIEREAKARLALDTDVLLSTAAQLEALLKSDPFPDTSRHRPSQLLVVFHRDRFPADTLKELAAGYDGPEELHASGRELVIDFHGGMGRSKLAPAMAKAKFPKLATGRNWSTVSKLAAML